MCSKSCENINVPTLALACSGDDVGRVGGGPGAGLRARGTEKAGSWATLTGQRWEAEGERVGKRRRRGRESTRANNAN